jgi:Winged helix-turn-helix DNA-binding
MTPRLLALSKAESHLIERLGKIEVRLDDDSACWAEYATIASALAAIAPALKPEALAEVLTQRELAERLGVSTRTVRRRVKNGKLVKAAR